LELLLKLTQLAGKALALESGAGYIGIMHAAAGECKPLPLIGGFSLLK
jgi:hypothetical protein